MEFNMNKRAQVATTITWIVATVIIIIILAISILLTSVFGKRSYNDKDLDEGDRADLLVTKSLLSYLLTKSADKMIFEQISEEKKFNSFNQELRDRVFYSLYDKEYPFKVLVKLNNIRIQLGGAIPNVIERIKIIDDWWIEANTVNK